MWRHLSEASESLGFIVPFGVGFMNEPKKPFALTRDDKNSPLWRKLVSHWESRIEALQRQNEGDQPESSTAKLRGRVAEIRANLTLSQELPNID